MAKNLKEMKLKELHSYIRQLTNEANVLIISKANEKQSRAYKQEMDLLRSKGIVGSKGFAVLNFNYREHKTDEDGNIIGSITRRKNKAELIQQARELEYFTEWQGAESRSKRDATSRAKYRAFRANKQNVGMRNISYQDWRGMVELFGTVSSYIEMFGYQEMKEIYNTYRGKGVNFIQAVEKAKSQVKGAGLDQYQAVDLLKNVIEESIK